MNKARPAERNLAYGTEKLGLGNAVAVERDADIDSPLIVFDADIVSSAISADDAAKALTTKNVINSLSIEISLFDTCLLWHVNIDADDTGITKQAGLPDALQCGIAIENG